jgi:dTDP-glucose 4,6-dehydratase
MLFANVMKTILVTGGCGFIGSNFIRLLCAETDWHIVNLDKLTYAGNLENLADAPADRVEFVRGDICDHVLIERILKEKKPWAIVNFAAESHVDRSILDAYPFLHTNVGGVLALLEAIRANPVERLLHVSTDEVYGDKEAKSPSTEESPLLPSSPYAATKAAADLLCFAYRRTHGLPVMVTRSSNNYGPYQFPEKLIPLLIRNGLNGLDLPVYGDGKQIREWLHVEDNCRAIFDVLKKGQVGSIYNIGTGEERTNLDVVHAVCEAIAERRGTNSQQIRERIRSVADRPGHDRRYAINSSKIRTELGWQPRTDFANGIDRTVEWYVSHTDWVAHVTSAEYRNYYEAVYNRAWGKGMRKTF